MEETPEQEQTEVAEEFVQSPIYADLLAQGVDHKFIEALNMGYYLEDV